MRRAPHLPNSRAEIPEFTFGGACRSGRETGAALSYAPRHARRARSTHKPAKARHPRWAGPTRTEKAPLQAVAATGLKRRGRCYQGVKARSSTLKSNGAAAVAVVRPST